jgi:DNA-binding response OmpR family regulator
MKLPAFEYSISILLIGEDKNAEVLLSETLKAVGYKTETTDSFGVAADVLKKSEIDLIVADPGNAGGSLREFLSSGREGRSIPLIFLTDSDDPRKSEYIQMGVDSILTRPFRIEKVEELIAATLLDYDKSSIVTKKKSKTILVVDDDETILSILGNALEILGYETTLTGSAEEALEFFKRENYDMLITDYMMPGLSGKELIAEVKEIKPDLPVIMITGYPLAYPPDVAKSEGIDAYLVKPFRINHLMDVISTLLPDKNSGRVAE